MSYIVSLLAFFTFLLYMPVAASAEIMVADIDMGGQMLGTYVLDKKGGTYTAKEEITVGPCKSKVLNDFGNLTLGSNKNGDLIEIQLKSECLQNRVENFRGNKPVQLVDSASVYLNWSVSNSLNLTGDSPFSYAFGTGIFAYHALFYSDFTKDTDTNSSALIKRGNSYATTDIVPNKMNITVGDTNANSGLPFSGSRVIGGLTIKSNFAVDPTFNPYDAASQTLTLSTKSTLEIYRDNVLVMTKLLPAGIYDLKELPINSFAGKLVLKIRDAYQNERIVEVPYNAPATVLKQGVSEYSFSGGLQRNDQIYKGAVLGGYYRYGLIENFTVGVHALNRVPEAALETVYTSKLGIIEADKTIGNLDYRVDYSYTNTILTASAGLQQVKGDLQFTPLVSIYFTPILEPHQVSNSNYGNLTLKAFLDSKNGNSYDAAYSVTPLKSVSLLLDVNKSIEGMMYSASTTYSFGWRNATLGFTASRDKSRGYAGLLSFTIPLENRANTWGTNFQESYSKRDGFRLDNDIRIKRGVIADFHNTYEPGLNRMNQTTQLSGSLACAYLDSYKCSIGEPISGGEGFILGEDLVVNNVKNKIVNVPSYYEVDVVSQGKYDATSRELAVRPGQGVVVDAAVFKSIIGKIYVRNAPYQYYEFIVKEMPGRSFITDKKGSFYLEHIPGKVQKLTLLILGKEVPIVISPKDKDSELVDMGVLEVAPK